LAKRYAFYIIYLLHCSAALHYSSRSLTKTQTARVEMCTPEWSVRVLMIIFILNPFIAGAN